MNSLMQTASALTLAAVLAGAPLVAAAQQQTTKTEGEQVIEEVTQETKEAAGEAEAAVEGAAKEVEQTAEGVTTEEAAEEKAEAIEEQGEQKAEALEEQAEAVEEQAEEQAEAIEEQAEEGEVAVAPVEGTIRMQDNDSVLTSDLIGATVWNPAEEKIGEIDDAILSLDGTVEGVVIGVGGFLGLGEKDVAVEMQQFSIRMDDDGDPLLILDTTKEALENAPEFVTAADQRKGVPAEPTTEGGMLTSDPVQQQPGMAPVDPAAAPATTGEVPAAPKN